jgi:hypothetical protein
MYAIRLIAVTGDRPGEGYPPTPPLADGELTLTLLSVKGTTGLAQKLGQLEAADRDLQSKSWANLQVLD